MDDESGETGIEELSPLIDPAADKAARDAEFTLFYNNELPNLVGFLVVQGARPVIAAEVAQDAMIEAYRHWDRIDSPRSWVRTVASRRWWRRAEHDRAEVLREEPPEHAAWLSSEQSDEIENRHAFLALARSLPVAQRQVLAWTFDGYRPTEIAAVLGKPAATVRSLLRDARAALSTRYRTDGETP